MKALDGIIILSINYADFLETFKTLKVAESIRKQEAYMWDFCSQSLVLTSRTALACLQETRLFKLMSSYVGPRRLDDKALVSFIQYVNATIL